MHGMKLHGSHAPSPLWRMVCFMVRRYQVEREIRIHIALEHENVIRLHAAFEDEKNVYMVQEFAGGGDLFEDLKRSGGQMKERQAVRDLIGPFLSSLVYMHARVRGGEGGGR